ncbi:MaoC family dehydratase N-terminal domain-containing protein [Arthrobacter sp. Alg241-R88]|uniref:FAS1-like dehydratase domain-containing protein n=1 Tax=Arthrobacter sp. Alg241-R88 TaxID=2305984 RepID=UPI0013D61793|nr:MaoC family dehydratase N-terminal domain-containing protein [Arthrobacter sp. Alg241-R88]
MTAATTGVPAKQITDEDVAYMKSFIGESAVVVQWNEEASTDSIRHYAWGIGDENPLWLSESYAQTTRHGTRIAPPTFLYSVCDAEVAMGMSEGIQAIHLGADLDFRRPIRLGERVRARAFVEDVRERVGRRSGRLVEQVGRTDYFVGEELVGIVRNTIVCVARSSEGQRMHEPRDPHVYTDEEKEQIRAAILAEEIRGQRTRFAETVSVGDVVPQVVKGPLDLITMTAYYAGAIGTAGYRGVETRVRQQERVRNGDPSAPTNLGPEHFLSEPFPSLGHQDAAMAHAIGMPGAYDNGNQRVSWMAHCVTNWMGDDADLVSLSVRIKQPGVFGDTQWIGGEATRVFRDETHGACAEVTVKAINQLGVETTSAVAVVSLAETRSS